MQGLIQDTASATTSPQEYLLKLAFVTALSYGLGALYIKCGRSVSNRPTLAASFPMLSVTTMIVITVVKSSLALSLGNSF